MKWTKPLGIVLGIATLITSPEIFGQGNRTASREEKQALRDFHRKEAQKAKKAYKKSSDGARSIAKLPYEAVLLTSIHYLNAAYPKDLSIDIEDGCQFTVRPSDMDACTKWRRGALLRISPCNSWFSSYEWYVTNIETAESAKAKLTRGPFENSPYNKHIQKIDCDACLVALDNGMVFQIYDSFLEREELKKWQTPDIVMIVDNNGWFSWGYKHILINIARDQYVRAVRIN